MKIRSAELASALNTCGAAVARNSTLPILANVLLTPMAEQLTVTGSDLEQQISVTIPAETGSADGPIAINHARLANIAQQTSADAITIGTPGANGQVSITAGPSRYRLATLPAADWPQWPAHQRPRLTASSSALLAAIAHSAAGAATNDVRYYLNGVLCELRQGTLHLVGTDGHRVHVSALAIDTDTQMTAIMPIAAAKSARNILSAATDRDGPTVTFGASEYDIEFATASVLWRAKLIDGRYPDWQRIMPQTKGHCTVQQGPLAGAIARVLGMKKGKYIAARLGFDAETLSVRTVNEEQDELDDAVPATADIAVTIAVNAEYLADAIAFAKNETIEIKYKDNDNALTIAPADTTSAVTRYAVVMPMRL